MDLKQWLAICENEGLKPLTSMDKGVIMEMLEELTRVVE